MNPETGRGQPKLQEGEASLSSQTPSGWVGDQDSSSDEVAEASSQVSPDSHERTMPTV